jgi:ABC-type lipoprotein release transport system permease subunit
MTRTRWLALGVVAIVAVTAAVLSQRGPARVAVASVKATRQPRFVFTVAASGEISDFSAVPQLWAVAAGLTVSVAVGIAAGYWPAQRAAALNPVEAPRHE